MKGLSMDMRTRRFATLIVTGALLFSLTACGGGSSGSTGDAGGRDTSDPAKAVVDSKCSLCHSLDRVYSATKTKAEWETTVTRMKSNGLVITDSEYTQVIEFLSR